MRESENVLDNPQLRLPKFTSSVITLTKVSINYTSLSIIADNLSYHQKKSKMLKNSLDCIS